MAAKDITTGTLSIAPHLGIGDQPDANEAVNTVFQAAFEVGFNKGLEAGLKEARQAAAQYSAAEHSAAPPAQPGQRRLLLGLPCPDGGRYFASDEAQCPRCKRPRGIISADIGNNRPTLAENWPFWFKATGGSSPTLH